MKVYAIVSCLAVLAACTSQQEKDIKLDIIKPIPVTIESMLYLSQEQGWCPKGLKTAILNDGFVRVDGCWSQDEHNMFIHLGSKLIKIPLTASTL